LVFLKQIDPQSGQPMIDHSAELVLINPEGRLAGYLLPPFTPEALAADLKIVLNARLP
jgi:protein SCO1/2